MSERSRVVQHDNHKIMAVDEALYGLESVVYRYEITPYQGNVYTTRNFYLLVMQETDSVVKRLTEWLESSSDEALLQQKVDVFKALYTRFKKSTSDAYVTISNSDEPDKELLQDYAVKVTQTFFRAVRLITDLLKTPAEDRVSTLNKLLTAGAQLRAHQIAANSQAIRLSQISNTELLAALENGASEVFIQDNDQALTLRQSTEMVSHAMPQRLVRYTEHELSAAVAEVSKTQQSFFSAKGHFDFSIMGLRSNIKNYLESPYKKDADTIQGFTHLVMKDLITLVAELEAYTSFTDAQTDHLQKQAMDYLEMFIAEVAVNKAGLNRKMSDDAVFCNEIYELIELISRLTTKINGFSRPISLEAAEIDTDERSMMKSSRR